MHGAMANHHGRVYDREHGRPRPRAWPTMTAAMNDK